MNIFSLFTLCGGLAFFLYGMYVMSKSLEKMAGGRLERLLKRMTSTPIKSLLLGAGITIAIQSSSAMTVMLVGLVNSGVMELGQTIGVIMGSNIGTTLTAWLLSLTGIESESFFVNFLKPKNFSPLLALAGILLIMGSKKQRRRDVGRVMMGFSILMYGMELMSGAVAPLADMPEFTDLMTAFTNPLLGVLVGAAFTGIIQSSAASVGILQALAMTGSVTYGMAIMGQNIGPCVTALISSIGVSRNAKRVSVIHISFNLIGTTVGLIILCGGNALFGFPFLSNSVNAVGIALCHTIFNVCTTILLLPFTRQLEWLAKKAISTEDKPSDFAFLDPRLLRTPGVAASECASMVNQMGALAQTSMDLVLTQFLQYTDAREEEILSNEDKLDIYEDHLGSYLVQISQHGTSADDMHTISRLLHGDFERIGDHVLNLQESAKELRDKQLRFSPTAQKEVEVLTRLLRDLMTAALDCFRKDDPVAAQLVEPLEETMDCLTEEVRNRHIHRLQNGQCTIQLGFVLNDLLNNFERIGDHCSNIAVSVIEEQDSQMASHAYLHDMKKNGEFAARLQNNLSRYALPPEMPGASPAEPAE